MDPLGQARPLTMNSTTTRMTSHNTEAACRGASPIASAGTVLRVERDVVFGDAIGSLTHASGSPLSYRVAL
jgi:hypothetical protein